MKKIIPLLCFGLFASCATSRIYLQSPEGATLYVDGKSVVFPKVVDLVQKDDYGVNENNGGRPVSLTLTDGTKIKGFIYTYKLKMNQVEKLANVNFNLSEEQIINIKQGHATTLLGRSASARPVYKLILGLDN